MLTPLFFRFNAVNIAIFPVQRRQRCHFSGSTPVMPLLFQFNAINEAIFPVQRR